MSNTPRQLTRNQLAEFLPNARAVRAFEQLLKQVGDLLPSDVATINRLIQEAGIEAAEGNAKAQSALDLLGGIVQDAAINNAATDAKANMALNALQSIADSLALLASAPARRDDNSAVLDYLDLRDNGWIPSYQLGRVWFGPTGTLEVAMGNGNITQQVGEELFLYGKASSAISDSPLQIVYQTGTVGASGVVTFAPTVAGITDGNLIVGVATESLATNAFGRITAFGVVHGITTNGAAYGETWADGDTIWYNPVTGNPTKVKPVAPNIKVQIGTVINAGSGGSGSFQVEINHGSVLGGTDSNVQLSSPISGNVLIYDAVAGYWKNALLTPGTNITITNAAGAITIAASATSAGALAFDTDGALAANSDTRIATQKATKTYVDNAVTGLLDFKGSTNCSGNPNYPAALKGDAYVVSVAGKIGGASGVAVDVGDVYVASADNAGGTQASVGSSWFILEHNLQGALLAANNLSDLLNAATARTNLGLAIGTDVQAFIAAGTTAQYWRGDKTWQTLDKSAVGLGSVTNDAQLKIASNLADVANAATARSNLGLAIGTNVQAWDADLDAIAALTATLGYLKKTAANTWSIVNPTDNYFMAVTTAGQSGKAAGWYTVDFDAWGTVAPDPRSNWNSTSNSYVADVAGWYKFTYKGSFNSIGTNSCGILIEKNGATGYGALFNTLTSSGGFTTEYLLQLNAGDAVTLRIYSAASGWTIESGCMMIVQAIR